MAGPSLQALDKVVVGCVPTPKWKGLVGRMRWERDVRRTCNVDGNVKGTRGGWCGEDGWFNASFVIQRTHVDATSPSTRTKEWTVDRRMERAPTDKANGHDGCASSSCSKAFPCGSSMVWVPIAPPPPPPRWLPSMYMEPSVHAFASHPPPSARHVHLVAWHNGHLDRVCSLDPSLGSPVPVVPSV